MPEGVETGEKETFLESSPKRKKSFFHLFRGSPPDHGWSWLVLLASFINITLIDGISFSFGVYFPEFLSYFKSSNSTTSWASSVLNGVYLSIGPVVSALIAVFGCRRVGIAGGLLFAAGLFASTFCPNIDSFIVVYGLLGGIGMGLIYLPSIIMVGFYFKKRRALATGVTVCGSGVGAFVFAPLGESLLGSFGWKGATWILSGIILNCVMCSCLYRTLDIKALAIQEDLANDICLEEKKPTDEVIEVVIEPDSDPTIKFVFTKHNGTGQSDVTANGIDRFIHDGDSVIGKDGECTDNSDTDNMISKNIQDNGHGSHFEGHSTTVDTIRKCTNLPEFAKTFLHELGDVKTMKNPAIAVYGLSHFLLLLGYFTPVTYLPLMAQELGVSGRDAAFLISILGIVTSLSRISVGFIADKPWTNAVLLNAIALIIVGIATIMVPFLKHYALLATYCGVFGFCMAAAVCLPSIISIQLVGLEKMPAAFGFITLCQGLSSFVGTPITGAIADMTGNFNISFYIAGILFILSGVITLPLKHLSRWHKKRNADRAHKQRN